MDLQYTKVFMIPKTCCSDEDENTFVISCTNSLCLLGYPEEHRIYFRRLSQTTQTDILLGNLDLDGSGKVVLRPLTVQDRIRELNLKARMFTDTMLAIQATSGPSPRHSAVPGPRSLQVNYSIQILAILPNTVDV